MSSKHPSEESPDDIPISSSDIDMGAHVLPEMLDHLSTPEATRYLERYIKSDCDARESDLLKEYRKDREERDNLKVELSRASSATGRAARNHITPQTILIASGVSTKTARFATQTETHSALSRVVRGRDSLQTRLAELDARLRAYQAKARSLGSILFEEKVDQYHDSIMGSLTEARYKSLDDTVRSITDIKAKLLRTFEEDSLLNEAIKGTIRHILRDSVRHVHESDHRGSELKHVPLSVKLRDRGLKTSVSRSLRRSELVMGAADRKRFHFIGRVRGWVEDSPFTDSEVVESLRENGYDSLGYPSISTEERPKQSAGILKKSPHPPGKGNPNRSVTFRDT